MGTSKVWHVHNFQSRLTEQSRQIKNKEPIMLVFWKSKKKIFISSWGNYYISEKVYLSQELGTLKKKHYKWYAVIKTSLNHLLIMPLTL